MIVELCKELLRTRVRPTYIHMVREGAVKKWDRRVAYLCGGILCLMAIGHGVAFRAMSQRLTMTTIDGFHAQAIRAVWLSIAAMFAGFGLLLLRAARGAQRSDWVTVVMIGAVLALSGSMGLVLSAGQPFWWQHVLLGLAIIAIGYRSRGDAAGA